MLNGTLLLARAVLALHVAFVGFVVLGLVFSVTGLLLRWSWVRNPAFRLTHLAAIGYVVLRSWCGIPCVLTTAEVRLRERAGNAVAVNAYDRIGQVLALRGVDPSAFRRSVTAWAALTWVSLSFALVNRAYCRTPSSRPKPRPISC